MILRSITITAGDTVAIDYTLSNPDGTAMDLTGATVRWGVSTTGAAGSALLTKSTGSGIVVTDAAAGELTVAISPGDIAAGHYWYELEVVLPDESSYTMARGWLSATATIYVS